MFPTISLGPLALPAPGLILLLGFWLAITAAEFAAAESAVAESAVAESAVAESAVAESAVAESAHSHSPKTGEARKPDKDSLYNLVFIALVAGILGARLVYAARNLSAFIASPSSLLSLQPALLDPLGGLAVAAAAAWIYGERQKLAFWPTLDVLAPGMAVMLVALGLSHLASGDAYGQTTGLPWAMSLWEAQRHPTQIYEIIAGLAILAAVWPWKGRAWYSRPGERFLTFAALASGTQLIIWGFRGDSDPLPAQIASWLLLAASLWALGKRLKLSLASVEVEP